MDTYTFKPLIRMNALMANVIKIITLNLMLVPLAIVSASAQKDTVLNVYSNEAEITASGSVTLKPGFFIPSGKNVRIFISAAPVVFPLAAWSPSSNQNYIRTRIFRVAGVTEANINAPKDVSKVNQSIQYIDGLGRSLQMITIQGSPAFRDVVQPIAYDAFGREEKKYLPYIAPLTSSNGSFKTAAVTDQNAFYTNPVGSGATGVTTIPDNTAFSKTVFEASPLNRVLEQGAPGSVWQPGAARTATAGRTAVIGYETNIANEVKLWVVASTGASGTDVYQPGKLYKTISKDENWVGGKTGTVEEFKDFDGRVVLKRIWETESVSLSTYYVYDDFGNLRYVVPPAVSATTFTEAVTDVPFNQFIYAYHYDGRNRLVEKKLPGKGWEFMVYNKLDQMVGSQDAKQRAKVPQEWLISKYDAMGRVILSGIYAYPLSIANTNYRKVLQDTVNARAKLWEIDGTAGNGYTNQSWPSNGIISTLVLNYYDDYQVLDLPAAAPYNLSDSYTKMLKGLPTVSRINVLGTSHMLWKVNYYDDKAQIVKSVQQHYKGGVLTVNNYDELSKTYLFSGEDSTTVRRHYVNGLEQLYIANRFSYDHLGRLKDTYQKTGDNAATTNAEILLSRNNYNETGQLTGKSLHSANLITPAFAQTISYTYNPRGWLKSQSSPLFSQTLKYEEATSGVTSQYNGNISHQEWTGGKFYNYSYDGLNRLKSGLSSDNYNEKSIRYDVMGNIQGMQRDSANTLIDQLKYNYNGNQLTSVSDSSAHTSAVFQLPGTTAYVYDVNGNMISRTNAVKGANNIAAISYNYLNLPTTMTAGGNAITYTYDATGVKLRKVVGSLVLDEYIGGIQYEQGVLKYLQTSEGRVVRNSATDYRYEYTLADHLGNGRLYFDIYTGVARKIQEMDYYPFGLAIQRSLSGTENKYQYNGKEKQEQEKMLDYGARFYDPVIGRWNVVDPMAEHYMHWSPYNYVMNNPLIYIDPDGMSSEAITTRYVNSSGKTILNTDDGRNDVVMVPENRMNEFLENAYWTDQSSNTRTNSLGWNNYWRDEFGIHISESTLNNAGHYLLETEASRAAQVKYLITNKASDFREFIGERVSASWSDPVNVISNMMAGATGYLAMVKWHPNSFESLLKNPRSIWGLSEKEVEKILGKGWKRSNLNSGDGWKFVEEKGDRFVSYTTGNSHHPNSTYYKMNSGSAGKNKVVGKGYVPTKNDKSKITYAN